MYFFLVTFSVRNKVCTVKVITKQSRCLIVPPQLTIKRLPILFHQLLYQAACAPTNGLGHLACVKASAQEERE